MLNVGTVRSAIALLSLVVLGACAARTSRASSAYVSTSPVDSIVTHLVELELQRISLLTTAPTDSSSMQKMDARIAALHERVQLLANHESADRTVRERLILALDARASTVTARLHEARLVYTDAY